MRFQNSIVAIIFHLVFATIGIAGIAIVPYRLWDIKTATHSDDESMIPVIALAIVMVGFSVYGLLFRERIYPKLFGQDLGDVPASENLFFGLVFVLIGLVSFIWFYVIAYGTILWGILLCVHALIQIALRVGQHRN